MNLLQRAGLLFFAVASLLFLLYRLTNPVVPNAKSPNVGNEHERESLNARVDALEKRVLQQQSELANRARRLSNALKPTDQPRDLWPKPIAVLVLACNRAAALKSQLLKLLKLRESAARFPIVVSQDCDNQEVANVAMSMKSEVDYIKHLSSAKVHVKVPATHRKYSMYYYIARHYRLGLEYVFNERKFDSVIILEDDLDVSSDFFDYFASTRWLLDADPTLYCVSAWNDNGRPALVDLTAHAKLYRSDFFPGLGWMLTRKVWSGLGAHWPVGFWDDWIRDPAQRKQRACIRPELSRTAMTAAGKLGASKGLFFNYYLKKIVLNDMPVRFNQQDQIALLKSTYDGTFLSHVYALPALNITKLLALTAKGGEYRTVYASMNEYVAIAQRMKLMADTKAGVPRTAYLGIVTCFFKGNRVHIAPHDHAAWSGYDPTFQAPPDVLSPIDANNSQDGR